ncbi:unnamed protein product [Ambrosiozyma monospora]|uniref:Unnamed protein product n=1 Tax=Ambrosiozyma monospora TaxID=43982 RepID=A0ACB5TEU2_AMBMO|nr:unnamed protein product [Ambrosiozyma monospora]
MKLSNTFLLAILTSTALGFSDTSDSFSSTSSSSTPTTSPSPIDETTPGTDGVPENAQRKNIVCDKTKRSYLGLGGGSCNNNLLDKLDGFPGLFMGSSPLLKRDEGAPTTIDLAQLAAEIAAVISSSASAAQASATGSLLSSSNVKRNIETAITLAPSVTTDSNDPAQTSLWESVGRVAWGGVARRDINADNDNSDVSLDDLTDIQRRDLKSWFHKHFGSHDDEHHTRAHNSGTELH